MKCKRTLRKFILLEGTLVFVDDCFELVGMRLNCVLL